MAEVDELYVGLADVEGVQVGVVREVEGGDARAKMQSSSLSWGLWLTSRERSWWKLMLSTFSSGFRLMSSERRGVSMATSCLSLGL